MSGFDFSGKTVWVTGAGKGIGYATALAFAEAGAQVTGFDLAFPQDDYPFATETLDVANAAQVSDVCGRVLASLERLDVLVNAAGILRMGATDQLSQEDWQQTFAVNVGGAFNLFQQTMGQFRRQQGGAIVTVASDAAHTPRIGMSAYGASKAALKSLALTVGLELAGSGIEAVLIEPGPIIARFRANSLLALRKHVDTSRGAHVSSYALMEDCSEVAEMTEALATFFRYTISNLENLVTLEDELANIENYYYIQQFRFGSKLDLKIQYDRDPDDDFTEMDFLQCKLPKPFPSCVYGLFRSRLPCCRGAQFDRCYATR